MQNSTEQLIETLRSYAGLNATFAQQQSISVEAKSVLKNLSNSVELSEEEYTHALSSGMDTNSHSRYKNAFYAQKIIDAFNKRDAMRHVLTDFLKKPISEMELLAASASRINLFISNAFSDYFTNNNLKTIEDKARPTIDMSLSSNPDDQRYREYLDNEFRRIIKLTEQQGLVDQVNLLNDIKREFLREVGIEKEIGFDPSYTPQHMDISLN